MNHKKINLSKVAVALSAALLVGCGGDSSSGGGTSTTSLSATIIDGYLQKADVFLDVNGNSLNDDGYEGTSGVGGVVTIDTTGLVNPEMYSLIAQAVVGQTIDQDTITDENPSGTPVTSSFTMTAPAGVLNVTPLTTLVQLAFKKELSEDVTNQDPADLLNDAKNYVAEQLGIDVNEVLDNFVQLGYDDLAYAAQNIVASGLLPEGNDELKLILTDAAKAEEFEGSALTTIQEIATVIATVDDRGDFSALDPIDYTDPVDPVEPSAGKSVSLIDESGEIDSKVVVAFEEGYSEGKLTASFQYPETDISTFYISLASLNDSGSLKDGSAAVVDLQIKGGKIKIRDGSSKSDAYTPGEWADIEVTWVDNTYSVSIDGVEFMSEENVAIAQDVFGIYFKVGSSSKKTTVPLYVDNIVVYSDAAGTTEVFAESFDALTGGDELTTANEGEIGFASNTQQALISAENNASDSDQTTPEEPGSEPGDSTPFALYYKDDSLSGTLTGSTFTAQTVTTTYSIFTLNADGQWTFEVPIADNGLGDLESDESVVETVDIIVDGETVTLSFTINSVDAKPDDGEDGGGTDPDDGEDQDPVYACSDAMDSSGSDSKPVVTGTTYSIDADDLSETLAAAVGGDEIVITSGDSISLKDICFDSPVLIRAETIGSLILESATLVRSQNIILQGFVFGPNDSSTLLKIQDSKNIKVLRNKFDHKGVTNNQNSIVMTDASEKITVAYNEFLDKDVIEEDTSGEYASINSGSYIKIQYDDDAQTMTKEAHIHHNYFKNIEAYVPSGESKPAGDSDREAIVFGDSGSQDIVTDHVIEYNLFEDCDGENEIMTVKTSGNTFNNNTFLNSMGSLSFRLGHDNTAENNYFYGTDADPDAATEYFSGSTVVKVPNYQTGGIRIYGENHILRGNYMENLTGDTFRLPLLVDSGDDSDSSGGNNHETTTNAVIEDNILVNNLNGGIQVGGTKYPNMPHSNILNNNIVIGDTETLYFSYSEAASNTWTGNTSYATGSATDAGGDNAGSGITASDLNLTVATSTPAYTKPILLTSSDVGTVADLAD